jgi:hypothetical protein
MNGLVGGGIFSFSSAVVLLLLTFKASTEPPTLLFLAASSSERAIDVDGRTGTEVFLLGEARRDRELDLVVNVCSIRKQYWALCCLGLFFKRMYSEE